MSCTISTICENMTSLASRSDFALSLRVTFVPFQWMNHKIDVPGDQSHQNKGPFWTLVASSCYTSCFWTWCVPTQGAIGIGFYRWGATVAGWDQTTQQRFAELRHGELCRSLALCWLGMAGVLVPTRVQKCSDSKDGLVVGEVLVSCQIRTVGASFKQNVW